MNDFLTRMMRHLAIGTLTGIVAGVIAGGLGSRLAMRIVALMTEASLQGRLTEAQARVGEITLGGTFFLIFFSTILGIYGGLLYRVTVAWLPAKTWQKGIGFGLFLLVLHGTMLIEGDNFDFDRFGIVLVNITMFMLLPITFGLIAAYTEAWLEQRYPNFAFRPKAVLLYLPALLGGLILVGLCINQSQSLSKGVVQGIGAFEQVGISLVMLIIIILSLVFEVQLKRFAYAFQLRVIVLILPALYGGFLLLRAINELLQPA